MKLEPCPRCGSTFYRGLRVEWVADRVRGATQQFFCNFLLAGDSP